MAMEFAARRNSFLERQGDRSYQTEDEGSYTGRRSAGIYKRRRRQLVHSIHPKSLSPHLPSRLCTENLVDSIACL